MIGEFWFSNPSQGNSSDLLIAEAYSDDFSSASVSSVEGKGGQGVLH